MVPGGIGCMSGLTEWSVFSLMQSLARRCIVQAATQTQAPHFLAHWLHLLLQVVVSHGDLYKKQHLGRKLRESGSGVGLMLYI